LKLLESLDWRGGGTTLERTTGVVLTVPVVKPSFCLLKADLPPVVAGGEGAGSGMAMAVLMVSRTLSATRKDGTEADA